MGEGCCGSGGGHGPRQESAGQGSGHRSETNITGNVTKVNASVPCGCGEPTSAAKPISLHSLAPGRVARVCENCLSDQDVVMLRAMGMKPGAMVRVCRAGEPCIVEVLAPRGGGPCGCDCSTRIGLAKDLAMRVMVIPAQGPIAASPA